MHASRTQGPTAEEEQAVTVPAGKVVLQGDLGMPARPEGMVLFAHGSGSSHHSPRNRYVAATLREAGLATLLIDLLSGEEEEADAYTGHLRFNIGFLAERLLAATDWLLQQPKTRSLPLGYFGASTGAAAALQAAVQRPEFVKAIVSRGGRPDLAEEALTRMTAPTLLIVGGDDRPVIELNRAALDRLAASAKQLIIIPGATHLFEEPGALEEVACLATQWFMRHLASEALPASASRERG
jgi:putative phosphoribosyl transferase